MGLAVLLDKESHLSNKNIRYNNLIRKRYSIFIIKRDFTFTVL